MFSRPASDNTMTRRTRAVGLATSRHRVLTVLRHHHPIDSCLHRHRGRGNLVLLAGLDAAVAGLLGYRAAALREASVRGALWSAGTSAVAIAVGAAAIRAMGIPRLVGPALLMFLFYLWDTLHATPPTRRRDPPWIREILVLVGLGAAVAFWNLRLVG